MFDERINKRLKFASGFMLVGSIATLMLSEPQLITKVLQVVIDSQQVSIEDI